jgi:hypothetical protein
MYIVLCIACCHFCVDTLSSYFLFSVCGKCVNVNAKQSTVLAVWNFMKSGFVFINSLYICLCVISFEWLWFKCFMERKLCCTVKYTSIDHFLPKKWKQDVI